MAKSKRNGGRALRFTHIHLENWQNFQHVDVDLHKRAFLVGPNASGKSNFLDAFRFLHDIASVGGGFQEAVTRRGGVSRLRCLAARRYPDIAIEAVVGSDDAGAVGSYELHFSQDNRARPIVKKERVVKNGAEVLLRPEPEDRSDPERLTQTFLEQVNVNKQFRDLADFFASAKYLHIVPQLVREPDRSVGRKDDPYGGDFLEQIAVRNETTRNSWLRQIQDALRVAVPQMSEVELFRDKRGSPHLRGKYEHWRPSGAWQTEDQFSDGTVRLIGLFWSILEGTGPLFLEEPELSLHPEIIRYLPQMFARMQQRSGRQTLISTHSPDLLNDDGIGLDEVLLLIPGREGTDVRLASDSEEIRALLEGGVPLADAVMPKTRPQQARQLALFGDL